MNILSCILITLLYYILLLHFILYYINHDLDFSQFKKNDGLVLNIEHTFMAFILI